MVRPIEQRLVGVALALAERDVTDAVMERGLFASQLSACKLRDERTIEAVTTAFGLA